MPFFSQDCIVTLFLSALKSSFFNFFLIFYVSHFVRASSVVELRVNVQLRKAPQWCFKDFDRGVGNWLDNEHIFRLELTSANGLWLEGRADALEWRQDDGFSYLTFETVLNEVPEQLVAGEHVTANFIVCHSFSLQFQRQMFLSRVLVDEMSYEMRKLPEGKGREIRQHISVDVQPVEIEFAFEMRLKAMPTESFKSYLFAVHADLRCPNGLRLSGSKHLVRPHIFGKNEKVAQQHYAAPFNAWMESSEAARLPIELLKGQVCAAVIREKGLEYGEMRTYECDAQIMDATVEHNGQTISLQIDATKPKHEHVVVQPKMHEDRGLY